MDTAGFTNLLTRPGPYATVLADVSQDSENAAHAKELRVRAACEELSAQGAPACEDLADVPAEVVELASGQRAADGGDKARDDAIRSALLDRVVRRRTALVRRLEEAWGRGDRAATGVRDVADAFVTGRVETLLLDPDALAGHTLDPAEHPGLTFGEAPVTGPVEAAEALIAATVLTDAEVCVLPASVLGGAPVAALLRWA